LLKLAKVEQWDMFKVKLGERGVKSE